MKKKCEVNYYGMLAELVGKSSETMEMEIAKNELATVFFIRKYPVLKKVPFQVAVDLIITENFENEDFKTISLLPPFAGG